MLGISEQGLVAQLSDLTGSSEAALRLLLTILAGYPIALFHRKFIYGSNSTLQHLYSALCGFLLGYWNYGLEMFHPVAAIGATYLVLMVIGGTTLSVGIIFICNLVHLLLGYYWAGTDTYDINWTMPHCILVLRLIGVAFDLYDGHQPPDTLSKENKKSALTECPSILEMYGHSLFPSSFLIGPQFPMRRYKSFVAGEFTEKGQKPDCITAAITRFGVGILYLTAFQVLGFFVSDDYMYSVEINEIGFFRRMFLLGIWGRYTLYKYISCWLLTEGACILFGLSYNGKDDNNSPLWDGVANVKLTTFENTTEFTHYIQSFNINTNHWVAQYIYKRLKFLGNKHISQLAVLLFLAVWHGFHSGYYVCFFFEFIVVLMERDLQLIVKSNTLLSGFFENTTVRLALNVLLRAYTFVFMGWCLLPFALLTYSRYLIAFSNFYYSGAILFLLWPVLYSPILKIVFKRNKTRKE